MDAEGVIIVWLVGLAFLPAVILLRRKWRGGLGMAFLLVWIGGSTAFGLFLTQRRPAIVPESEIAHRPIQSPKENYVSSQTCRSCHPGEYHTWHGSYHRSMTQVASPESVLGDFDDTAVSLRGHDFQLSREGDSFWVEMEDFNHTDQFTEPLKVKRRIEMTTGSHHMQIYWLASGDTRKMDMLPIVWLNADRRWVPRTSIFLMPPTKVMNLESGRWNRTCIMCHTTGEQPGLHSDRNMDSKVSEFGIACEACHGPGREHVQHHRNLKNRYAMRLGNSPDTTIVTPTDLVQELDSQTCGQCHSVLEQSHVATYEQWMLTGKQFEPGDRLSDTLKTIQVGEPSRTSEEAKLNWFWNDGMIRVSGREHNGLIDSPCYVHGIGDRKLSCFSCHAMHPKKTDPDALHEWANDQLKPGMRSNQACLQCHQDYDANLAAHTHHPAESTGSLCYNCHMPHTTYGLLTAIRSHEISSPSVDASLKTGRPNACNQCHLDKTLKWTAEHLRDWHEIPIPEIPDEHTTIAASVLWLLKGDAGQRALMAWSLGWEPARKASGDSWMARHLAILLNDPYDTVRYIALRSLRRLPGFHDFSFDYVADDAQLREGAERALAQWDQAHAARATNSPRAELLMKRDGSADEAALNRLLQERDNRPIFLNE
jgi:hypothetical protein